MLFFGDEALIRVYNNLTLVDFLKKIEDITTIPANQIVLRVSEETLTRRINKQTKNLDNPNILNTLKDLKIMDNAGILVETKGENEVDDEQQVQTQGTATKKKDEFDIMHIDDTENIRTVLVNTAIDLDNIERFQINIDWSLEQLHSFLFEKLKLQGTYRIRNLTYKRLFVLQELETPLRNYPDFLVGGARIQIEEGRYPSLQELALKVVLFGNLEDQREFYFPSNCTVKEW